MVKVNGDYYQLESPMSLYDFLENLNYDMKAVVAEVDKKIVKREDFKSFTVKDGMEIEVFAFVGGG